MWARRRKSAVGPHLFGRPKEVPLGYFPMRLLLGSCFASRYIRPCGTACLSPPALTVTLRLPRNIPSALVHKRNTKSNQKFKAFSSVLQTPKCGGRGLGYLESIFQVGYKGLPSPFHHNQHQFLFFQVGYKGPPGPFQFEILIFLLYLRSHKLSQSRTHQCYSCINLLFGLRKEQSLPALAGCVKFNFRLCS